MKNILFRADASFRIGTGHIMRDLVLAEQYPNSKIIFATQELEGNLNYKIIESGYEVVTVDSNSINEVNKLIKKYDIDMLVIDHYGINYDYEKALKEENSSLTILSFDDTYEKHYCDILLNHNVFGDVSKYENLVPSTCKVRCGKEYTLLRNEFIVAKKKVIRSTKQKRCVFNIFIAMGGADHSNINIKILKVLQKFPNIHIHLVTTTSNQHLLELKQYINLLDNITLYVNTNKIAQLMSEANFAIITPSVTINEVLYLEIPFIAIKTADNQKYMCDYLEKKNLYILEKFNSKELKKYIDLFIH